MAPNEELRKDLDELSKLIKGNGEPGMNERLRTVETFVIEFKDHKSEEKKDRRQMKRSVWVGLVLLFVQLAIQIFIKIP